MFFTIKTNGFIHIINIENVTYFSTDLNNNKIIIQTVKARLIIDYDNDIYNYITDVVHKYNKLRLS